MSVETETNQKMHGLRADRLSFGEILAQSFAGIAPSTTPAAVLGPIFALSGNGTWLSFLLGLIGVILITININHFASRWASSGSLYPYISKALGLAAGVICSWSLIFGYLFSGMAYLCGVANFVVTFLGYVGIHSPGLDVFILALAAIISWYFVYKDIQLSAVTMLRLELSSLIFILILCAILWYNNGFALDMQQLSLKGVTPGNVAMGIVLVIFSFTGFEGAVSLGDESKKPLQNIPKALMWSNIISGSFFIITAYIVILAFHATAGTNLAKTHAPLTFLAQNAGLGHLGQAVAVGAMLSFFAGLLGSLNPVARIVFTMSRSGLFPISLGSSHTTNRTPYKAATLSSLLIFLVPLLMTVNKIKLFDSLGYLGAISTFGFLSVYILISIAAPVYLYRINRLRSIDIITSIFAVMFILFPILGSIGIRGSSWFPVPDYPNNIFPHIYLLYLIITTIWFMIQRKRHPGLPERMRTHIEQVHLQFLEKKDSTLLNQLPEEEKSV